LINVHLLGILHTEFVKKWVSLLYVNHHVKLYIIMFSWWPSIVSFIMMIV